jgi:hypothetical protein
MAGEGKRLVFHGAFADKARAVVKEREVGGWIIETEIRGQRRYAVVTRRKSGLSAADVEALTSKNPGGVRVRL